MLPPEGMQVEQTIRIGPNVNASPGNVTILREIPEGTSVFNIEHRPGDGGQFVRSGGTSATVVSQGLKTVVQLPSGQFKPLDPSCRATVGVLAGGGRGEKPFLKAGKRSNALRSRAKKYPWVSGVAMNPVNHPHGGGSHQHVGTNSSVSRHAPPGRKVGRLAPKKRRKAGRKKKGR
jgi:large subunit ribosomal protein L2